MSDTYCVDYDDYYTLQSLPVFSFGYNPTANFGNQRNLQISLLSASR